MSKRLLRITLLLVLLGALVPLKAQLRYGLGKRANDADYYYTIARSVAEGEGLKSNLSLYYQGFKTLPHFVTGSPAWPLLLGAVGAVVGLDSAAVWLPNALYMLALALLYGLALRLRRGIEVGGGGWLFRDQSVVTLGHVAVLLFATNVVFFRFSSVPNNEPLALCLVFGALLALDRAARECHVGWAFAAGALAGLAVLTRIQALAVAIAVPATLVGVALSGARARRLAPMALVAALLPFVPWLLYLASWNDAFELTAVLGLETQRETPELDVFRHAFFPKSMAAFVVDRLRGVGVAFDPRSSESYIAPFGWVAYAVPVALLHFAWRLLRSGPATWFKLAPERALPVATVATGIGMLLPVHAAHMTFVFEWLFGFRHGLPLILLIVPALAYLDAHARRIGSIVVGVLLLTTLIWNVQAMQNLFDRRLHHGLSAGEKQLVTWLDGQSPRPSVVTTQPWMYGAFSRSGYHWTLCGQSPEQTLKLLRHAGADYVLVRNEKERRCNFVRGLRPKYLRDVRVFGGGIYVLELRDPDTTAPARAGGAMLGSERPILAYSVPPLGGTSR